ncbi:alpha-N-arabinofuranosidase [Bacteroidota bacterium]
MKQLKLLLSLMIILIIISCSTNTQQEEISENTIDININSAEDTISRYIYGHFAEHLGRCIYDGIWVGEKSAIPNTRGMRNDVIDALKELEIPVLRWPGGCYADLYQWKDGIGPKDKRPGIVNKFWGNVLEDNSFGTHEFLDLCEILGTDAYLAVNVGSGSMEDAYDWIEYVNSDMGPMANLRRKNGREKPWKVKYWGIGNENWGCGGNMDAEYYTDLFKRYATYCWVDYRVASGGLNHDLNWTETLMKGTQYQQHLIQGISYHHYTVCHEWSKKGSATEFDESEWFSTLKKNFEMEENMVGHIKVMEKYDPENKVALIADEWGNWHDSEPGTNPGFLYQQNTLRDALTAAVYLNIFNKHAYRVKMANIAQTVNVLQAMLLTNDKEIVKTPTFYVFKMYKVHMDALLLPIEMNSELYQFGDESIPALSASASKNKDGNINITIANVNPNKEVNTTLSIDEIEEFDIVTAEVITSDEMNDLNDFDMEEKVNIQTFEGYEQDGNNIIVNMPPKSIVLVTIK